MTEELSRLVADGCGLRIVVEQAQTLLVLTDWRETEQRIRLVGVVWLEDWGFVGESLAAASWGLDPNLLTRVCESLDENPADFQCLKVYGSWGEKPILQIVAESVHIMIQEA